MRKSQQENAINSLKDLIARGTNKIHSLTMQRKEVAAMISEKEKHINSSFNKDVNQMREKERNKRLELYGELEEQRQHVTSTLMLELLKICREDNVPAYIHAIAKVLDNYQGIYF